MSNVSNQAKNNEIIFIHDMVNKDDNKRVEKVLRAWENLQYAGNNVALKVACQDSNKPRCPITGQIIAPEWAVNNNSKETVNPLEINRITQKVVEQIARTIISGENSINEEMLRILSGVNSGEILVISDKVKEQKEETGVIGYRPMMLQNGLLKPATCAFVSAEGERLILQYIQFLRKIEEELGDGWQDSITMEDYYELVEESVNQLRVESSEQTEETQEQKEPAQQKQVDFSDL